MRKHGHAGIQDIGYLLHSKSRLPFFLDGGGLVFYTGLARPPRTVWTLPQVQVTPWGGSIEYLPFASGLDFTTGRAKEQMFH
jgi:hypothetical protein